MKPAKALLLIMSLVVAAIAVGMAGSSGGDHGPGFSTFLQQLSHGDVRHVVLDTGDNTVHVKLRPGLTPASYDTGYPDAYGDQLIDRLERAHVDYDVKGSGSSVWGTILIWLVPVVLFVGLWFLLTMRVGAGRKRKATAR